MESHNLTQDENKFVILLQNANETEVESIIDECAPLFFQEIPTELNRKKLMRRLAKSYFARARAAAERFTLLESDVRRCQQIDNPFLKKLFYCLVVQSRLHPHKNGWVELDWPNVLSVLFDKASASKIKIESLADLRAAGLDMRVIGSQKPILCFAFPPTPDETPRCELTRAEAKDFFYKEIGT